MRLIMVYTNQGSSKGSDCYYDDVKGQGINYLRVSSDETQVMRYKLVTLPKNTTRIPKVSFGVPNISVSQDEEKLLLTQLLHQVVTLDVGYTAVVLN